ncbi:MAG: BatD family protein [Treponema sp.]|jgi:hypothetical protein|nr:BatD family protein [Treponema sp.]
MEKPGLGRRRRLHGPGLLAVRLLCLCVTPLAGAQEGPEAANEDAARDTQAEILDLLEAPDEKPLLAEPEPALPEDSREPITLILETDPPSPRAGEPWTLTLLIDHEASGDLRILPPDFPETIALEQARTTARVVNAGASAPTALRPDGSPLSRWTAAEFTFTLLEAGELLIPPFQVLAEGKRGFTGALKINVAEAAPVKDTESYILRWTEAPAFLTRGSPGEAALKLIQGPRDIPAAFFKGLAPLNAILEELPRQGRGLYRFRIIPLGGKEVVLGPWDFSGRGLAARAPRLAIPLRAAGQEASPTAAPPLPAAPQPPGERGGVPSPSPDARQAPLPFPELTDKGVPLPFRGAYHGAAAEARALWEAGRRPETLAFLRGAERRRLYGPALTPLRAALEEALGVSARAEPWRPAALGTLCAAGAGLCGLAFAGLLLLKRARRRAGGFVLWALPAACLLLGAFAFWLGGGKGRSAVLRAGAGSRAPDVQALSGAVFPEGQSAAVVSRAGAWVCVDVPGKEPLWVREETALFY